MSFVHAELHACCCCECQPGGSTRNKAEPNVDPATKGKIKEEQRKDFFLFFFTEDLNRLVCERLSVHACANTFFCFGLVWGFFGCCFVVVIYFSTVAFIFSLWFNLCLFASAQKSFELISSTPLLRIIICNNKPSKCLCLSVCLSLSVSL